MDFEITEGIINGAQKVVFYGPEGIGKTTFAMKFPDPLFIDTEGSTKKYDVRRLPKPTSWQMLIAEVQSVIKKETVKHLLLILPTGRKDYVRKLSAQNMVNQV